MICPPCRRAGELNKLLPAEPGVMQHVEIMIKATHADCPKGNWCDCQHVIGPALNYERIKDKDAVTE